jgi:toxin ParE1/3/4
VEKAWPVKVHYSRRAIGHLLAIYGYIAGKNPAAAARVSERIEYTIGFLREFPHSGRPGVRLRTRESRVTNLPYIIVYRLEADDSVLVLGIYHTAQRRPGRRF